MKNNNVLTMSAKLVGRGHGMRIVPFPDKTTHDVLSVSHNYATREVTIEYIAKTVRSKKGA